jgi:hypothetical protein
LIYYFGHLATALHSRIPENMQEDSSHVHVSVRVPVSTMATTGTVGVTVIVISMSMTRLGLVMVMRVLPSSSLCVIVIMVIMRVIVSCMSGMIVIGGFFGDPLGSTDRGLVTLGPSVMGERVDSTVRGSHRVRAQWTRTGFVTRAKRRTAQADRSVARWSTISVLVSGLDDGGTGLSGVSVKRAKRVGSTSAVRRSRRDGG